MCGRWEDPTDPHLADPPDPRPRRAPVADRNTGIKPRLPALDRELPFARLATTIRR